MSSPKRKPLSVAATLLLLAAAVAYIQLGPWVSRKLGVALPGLESTSGAAGESNPAPASNPAPDAAPAPSSAPTADAEPAPAPDTPSENEQAPSKSLGQLRTQGGSQVSSAGLRYGRGSADGTRLDHVLQHAADDPSKPVHGVFDGDRQQVLSQIDRAYLLALRGGPQVKASREGRRTVYTVDMRERIGYVGGQKGRRLDFPAVQRIRLVLEGANLITAYPVER